MLSRTLAAHPDVLSVFEFLNGLDVARRFQVAPLSGPEYAELISREQPFLTAVLRRGHAVPEVIYPFGEGARYRRDAGLPWILVGVLPRLSEAPDADFDAALAFARGRPPAPAAAHHLALFAWLAERYRRPLWIERSGSSIEYLPALVRHFPGARFVHLHRDGAETALSMREHHAYRLPISLLYGAASGEAGPAAAEIDLHAAPRPDDAIARILAARPPAHVFGRYWSDQLERGLADCALPPDRLLHVGFESLVAAPAETLARIGAFFALPDAEAWARRAARLVRGRPPTRADSLGGEERRALDAACAPGRAVLRSAAC